MTHGQDENIDLNSIQDQNLAMLQKSIENFDVANTEENQVHISQNAQEENLLENIVVQKQSVDLEIEKAGEVLKNSWLRDINNSVLKNIFGAFRFLLKYLITASFIFIVLMACTNYSAYITIAKSYLNPELIAESEKIINKSLAASQISVITANASEEKNEEDDGTKLDIHNAKDIRNIVGDIRNEDIHLDIEIIPFVNRVVIPKIGKNIPLVDIGAGKVEGLDELNDIFMSELEGGVVRYPGSAKPGEYGNAFIFGHSSNFPWVAGDYNDVFALLDRLEIGDEVVSYYEGKKYTYKIHEKKVISPNDVSILKRNTGKKEITLMTCWPIGTTYNRLLLIGELVQ